MEVAPLNLSAAQAFVATHHRHNKAPRGHRFSIALWESDLFDKPELIGVAIIGRPVARHLDDGLTAEVTRLCVLPHAPLGACSKLYRAGWRAWRAMGGRRLVTYTLQTECGASLRGAGFTREAELPGRNACRWLNRVGREDQSVTLEPKVRWTIGVLANG